MDKKIFSVTGGASVGSTGASWPLAKLTVHKNLIDLRVKPIGTYSFSPLQVISLRKHTTIPILNWGIRIVHNNPEYPEKVKFTTFSNPEYLIDRIAKIGFVPKAEAR